MSFEWSARAVVLGGAFLSWGCPNPNAYTVPRTLNPGELQVDFAAEGYGYTTKITTPATLASPASAAQKWGATPMLPTMGVRYGLLDGLDVGARLENFFDVAADLKWQVRKGWVDLALDPGFQAIYASVDAVDSSGNEINQTAGIFYLHAPLLVGVNLSDMLTLVASPGVAYSISTGAIPAGSHAEQAGAQTELLARLGFGIDIRTSDRFALHPEATCLKGFTATYTLVCVLGLSLNFGAQPDYSDLAPPSPTEP